MSVSTEVAVATTVVMEQDEKEALHSSAAETLAGNEVVEKPGTATETRTLTKEPAEPEEQEKVNVPITTRIASEVNCSKECNETTSPSTKKDVKVEEKEKRPGASDKDPHTEHMSYAADGSAIYTDPVTHSKYKWNATSEAWEPLQESGDDQPSSENPYENEHYKWDANKGEWVAKVSTQSLTETEHYKWDAEQNKWVPKVSTGVGPTAESSAHSLDANGERTYTDKDGVVFFWDTSKSAWFPKIDDDFMARYQMNYGFVDNTTSNNSKEDVEKRARLEAEAEAKRREEELQRMTEEARAGAAAAAAGVTTSIGKHKAQQEPPKWFELDAEHNTKVYVSNLPLDITIDEFAELMGKCGMIMRDAQTQKFKLKLYQEADGQLKGDGLCDYIKIESVQLALNILDDYVHRGHKIHVQRAKFTMRGEYNPALRPKRRKKDKEKLQKMKEKLFDWRPERMRGERGKHEKVVIIKNLFHPEIFESEVQLLLDYQNDLREECTKCGTVRKVVIYDRHPEGVAQVNMATPEEADVVIQMMHGRFFGKRKLTADHWDGQTKYKVDETEAEVANRLTNWDKYLEAEAETAQAAAERVTPPLSVEDELADENND